MLAGLSPSTSNVAASLRLAAGKSAEIRVRVIAVPGGTENVHEIQAVGDFGRFRIVLENVPSPIESAYFTSGRAFGAGHTRGDHPHPESGSLTYGYNGLSRLSREAPVMGSLCIRSGA